GGARHPLEELSAVQDADSVQEHRQTGQADRTDDLRLRRKGADREADEQNGADTKRKAADVDLTHQVAEANREKNREDRLRPDDVLSKLQHDSPSKLPRTRWRSVLLNSAHAAAGSTKLLVDPTDELRRRRRRIEVLVVEPHRLPLEL